LSPQDELSAIGTLAGTRIALKKLSFARQLLLSAEGDKICREDILRHVYALARANAGAPGVDGVTFAQIDALSRPEPGDLYEVPTGLRACL
jgi:hypothetical protein